MGTCVNCYGEGNISCSGCGGSGYVTRFTDAGALETKPCLICGGQRRMRCDQCAGTGKKLHSRMAGTSPNESPMPGKDALAGTWRGMQGGAFEFINKGDHYELKEYNLLGRTGTGYATLAGNTVILEVTNVLLGRYSFLLQLRDNKLQGSMKVMGIPVPMVLTRSEVQDKG